MVRSDARLSAAERALLTLREIIAMETSTVVRDAAIQRFEYTFEVCWKALKAYLLDVEGVACASPNQCFREALRVGLCSQLATEELLAMTGDRNLTAHTYVEAIAARIYAKLPEHTIALGQLLRAILDRLPAASEAPGQ